MKSLLVLGRQPALGLAELESLYGADKVQSVGDKVAIVDVDPCLLAFDRLGGSVKFCKILTSLDTTDWQEIEKFLVQVSPDQSQQMPEGKMRLGFSVIGLDISLKQLLASGLTLKKAISKTGRNVRLVPNKSSELNTAQVLHNQLTGPTGWELVFIRAGGQKTIIAQTVKVQDIEAYAKRDRERPKRDAKVGMLPPKLAQIIINLAAGQLPEDKLQNICGIPADQEIPLTLLNQSVLDPFCGTGVVLQEAALMGYYPFGTDLEQRMIEYSDKNLEWLIGGDSRLHSIDFRLHQGDATTAQWKEIDFVASETYLGRPFTSMPSAEILTQTIADCNLIIKKFLQNIHGQLEVGTRLCLAVPAWQTKRDQFKHLPLIDQISDLGYNRVSFEHAGDDQLIYYRPDQIVARQLIVITRK
jgi:tRNA (guanine10-N2)-dimethyltransferase